MIKITEQLFLKAIKSTHTKTLYTLMQEVYALSYSSFWKDKGQWYIDSQYAKEVVLKELLETNADYYFIVFNNEVVGIFRFVWDQKLKENSEEKQVKLHRVYIHPKAQHNGLGKTLLTWLEEKAQTQGYTLIWLDAMNEQPQAYQFYKKQGYKHYSHTFLTYDLLHYKVRKMSQLYKKI